MPCSTSADAPDPRPAEGFDPETIRSIRSARCCEANADSAIGRGALASRLDRATFDVAAVRRVPFLLRVGSFSFLPSRVG